MTLKDSKVDRGWLQRTMQAHPPRKMENGNYFSGPVRLAFVNLAARGKPQKRDDGSQGEGKFGCTILFPPGSNLDPLWRGWFDEAGRVWQDRWDPTNQKFQGLEWPFHDQGQKAFGEKALAGYEAGSIYLNISSNYKPPVVDAAMNEIVDENRIYAGVWAVIVMNTYGYGRNPPRPKKGVGFGVQSVMLIGDDQKLGGGAPDPKTVFAGVNIQAAVDPIKQFSGMPSMGGGMPGGGMPTYPLPSSAPAAGPSEQDVLAKLMGG